MNASLASRLDDITAPLAGTCVASTAGLESGQVLGHRYRIDGVLQSGGMATVYEATQLDLARKVAIKVPTAECTEHSPCARRFEREAQTLAELAHPHIVSVFELGRSEEGVAFMAMELVEGPTLRAHLTVEQALPWRVAAVLAAQLADALQAAHIAGVIHGDLSATNVLLSRRGDRWFCKLIDFGAARRIGDGNSPHTLYGTKRYAAPELFKGSPPTVPSDLFALGTLLKEMLGDATLATGPQSLQQLVASMSDVDPQERPASAAEVALRLRDALDSQSSTTPPELAKPLHADRHGASARSHGAAPPAVRTRKRLIAAALVGCAAACAIAASVIDRQSVAGPAASGTAAAPQFEAVAAKPAAVRVANTAPPLPQSPAPVQSVRPTPEAKVASSASQRVPAPVLETASTPAPEPEGRMTDDAQPIDESIDRAAIVASLDRWLNDGNQKVARERAPVMAVRLGDADIAFDPSGTSAGVTYRKRLAHWRANRLVEWIVEEQVFFAKQGDTWQIVNTR